LKCLLRLYVVLSYKIEVPPSKNSVYEFKSVYVHEFEKDNSLILVATEDSRIELRSAERIRDIVWNPKISSIRRPVNYTLQGIVITIYSNSGLIKRCNSNGLK
jgi:hypothetical protein